MEAKQRGYVYLHLFMFSFLHETRTPTSFTATCHVSLRGLYRGLWALKPSAGRNSLMARRDIGHSFLARLIDSFRPPLELRLFNVYVNNLMCLPTKLIIIIKKNQGKQLLLQKFRPRLSEINFN